MATTREPIECPHCGEPTLPNALSDGTTVCSCAAERELPPPCRHSRAGDAGRHRSPTDADAEAANAARSSGEAREAAGVRVTPKA